MTTGQAWAALAGFFAVLVAGILWLRRWERVT